jgi:uncharacterized protein YjbJ (UPF0337 family)
MVFDASGHAGTLEQEARMNRDQVWGRLNKARAKVKELTGTFVGHRALISQARADFTAGRDQAEFGDAKSAVEERRLTRRRDRLGHAR